MRKIEYSSSFKKDWKRESKGKHSKQLEHRLQDIVNCLLQNKALDEKYRDHELIGNWRGYRECHVWPDLLLIYKIVDDGNILRLARLGSHANLFK